MWDPTTYLAYGDERARPFLELVARISSRDPRLVVDLGCGPGNLTAHLGRRWPNARVLGLDSSPEMIDKAREQVLPDRIVFQVADARAWIPPVDVDVVVTNATLQWIPDHVTLLAQWLEALQPGAWFGLQVPANFDAPSHVLMRELAESTRWRSRLDGVLRHTDAVAAPHTYLEIMAGAGCTVDVWQSTYLHVLPGEDAVLRWVRGTGLRPVLAVLDPDEVQEFEDVYGSALREAYPATPQGTVFPFTRTFAVARR